MGCVPCLRPTTTHDVPHMQDSTAASRVLPGAWQRPMQPAALRAHLSRGQAGTGALARLLCLLVQQLVSRHLAAAGGGEAAHPAEGGVQRKGAACGGGAEASKHGSRCGVGVGSPAVRNKQLLMQHTVTSNGVNGAGTSPSPLSSASSTITMYFTSTTSVMDQNTRLVAQRTSWGSGGSAATEAAAATATKRSSSGAARGMRAFGGSPWSHAGQRPLHAVSEITCKYGAEDVQR